MRPAIKNRMRIFASSSHQAYINSPWVPRSECNIVIVERSLNRNGGAHVEQSANPEVRKTFPDSIPLGREGEADEVAEAVAFLAGGASKYITGEALQINGGIYFV